MAAAGITVIKTFPYRGGDEEWGNTYHFVGSAPSNPSDWRALADELISLEVAVYTNVVTVVRALCYENTDDDSVYTYHLADFGGTVSGAFVSGDGGHTATGDDAVWCAWDTGKRSTKGKPIWLRKYFHDAHVGPSQVDQTDPDQVIQLSNLATGLVVPTGAWPGIADPEGDAPTGGTRVSAFVTTRSLKRRGRRPTSPH